MRRRLEEGWECLDAKLVLEPNPQDKVMIGMLKTLGIEKGKPFNSDATTKKAMRQAAIDAWFYLQH